MILAAVVVPFRNSGSEERMSMLEAALDALLAQTIRDRLLIILSLDGGDPLPQTVSGKADLVVEGEPMGPAAARNRGWRAADTRYVLFTDSDCVPEADWAERLTGALESGRFDGAKGTYSDGGSRLIQRLAQVEFCERYEILSRAPSGIDMVDTYSAAFTLRALRKMQGFDEDFPAADHEDVDLSYRMREAGMRFVFVPEARVGHTHRPTWAGYLRMKSSRGYWRTRVAQLFPGRTMKDRYVPRMLKAQMALVGLVPVLIPAALLTGRSFAGFSATLWALLFIASTLPLFRTALKHDSGVSAVIPLFALWRGIALVSGVVRGMLSGSRTPTERKC